MRGASRLRSSDKIECWSVTDSNVQDNDMGHEQIPALKIRIIYIMEPRQYRSRGALALIVVLYLISCHFTRKAVTGAGNPESDCRSRFGLQVVATL